MSYTLEYKVIIMKSCITENIDIQWLYFEIDVDNDNIS